MLGVSYIKFHIDIWIPFTP